MLTSVECISIGPFTPEQALRIREAQRAGKWGYWPEVHTRPNGSYVVMHSERDAAAAKEIAQQVTPG